MCTSPYPSVHQLGGKLGNKWCQKSGHSSIGSSSAFLTDRREKPTIAAMQDVHSMVRFRKQSLATVKQSCMTTHQIKCLLG